MAPIAEITEPSAQSAVVHEGPARSTADSDSEYSSSDYSDDYSRRDSCSSECQCECECDRVRPVNNVKVSTVVTAASASAFAVGAASMLLSGVCLILLATQGDGAAAAQCPPCLPF